MKVLRIISSLNPSEGGPVQGIYNMTAYMDKLGVSTTVISLDSPTSHWLQNNTLNCLGLGPAYGTYRFCRSLPSLIRKLAYNYDAVIVHGIWQYHSYATWRALRNTSIPYFVYPHGMLDPWFKHRYPLKHLKKWVYWLLFEYRVLRDAKAVLFTTEEECKLARNSFWLYDVREIVAGYGTSSSSSDLVAAKSEFFDKYSILDDKRIFLFMGRIHPKKGIDILIQAFALVCDIDPLLHLVIAGPDQVGLQASLHRLAEQLGVASRITWTGMLDNNLKWGAFYASELFCLPSHQENFGIVVAEALSCSLPVCISQNVNISSDVSSNDAGIVHKNSITDAKNALSSWLHMSEQERFDAISSIRVI